jgi:hypothetical protein
MEDDALAVHMLRGDAGPLGSLPHLTGWAEAVLAPQASGKQAAHVAQHLLAQDAAWSGGEQVEVQAE